MARKGDYIPNRIADFFSFQKNLVSMVIQFATDWLIAPEKVDALEEAQTEYEPTYQAATNPATRTKSSVRGHTDGRKKYVKIIRKFVIANLKGNPLVSNKQKVDMGLNPNEERHKPRPAIQTAVVVFLRNMGNFRIGFECRVEDDSTRASIHKESDGLEIRYCIGTEPPATEKQANLVIHKKRARFFMLLDMSHAGKTLYAYARWVNLSDETKNGPWSKLAQVRI